MKKVWASALLVSQLLTAHAYAGKPIEPENFNGCLDYLTTKKKRLKKDDPGMVIGAIFATPLSFLVLPMLFGSAYPATDLKRRMKFYKQVKTYRHLMQQATLVTETKENGGKVHQKDIKDLTALYKTDVMAPAINNGEADFDLVRLSQRLLQGDRTGLFCQDIHMQKPGVDIVAHKPSPQHTVLGQVHMYIAQPEPAWQDVNVKMLALHEQVAMERKQKMAAAEAQAAKAVETQKELAQKWDSIVEK